VIVNRRTLDSVGAFGSRSGRPGDFQSLHNIAADSKGNLYTAEVAPGARIQKFQVTASQSQARAAVRSSPRGEASGPAARTPWGDPDLQGVWTSATRTPLERPAEFGTREFLTDKEIATRNAALAKQARDDETAPSPRRAGQTGGGPEHWYERGRITSRRTSIIVDPPNGRLPALTPEAATRHEAEQQRFLAPASAQDLGIWVRCIGRGIPGSMLPTGYNNNYQILQAPGVVAILYEMIHDVRVIPLDGRPRLPSTVRQWLGNALGRWEGNTLVVETTNFREEHVPISSRDGIGSTTSALRVVERFTRTDANTIEYRATVEDPNTYTRPWTAVLPLTRGGASDRLFEYACHEGNYAATNILTAARTAEASAAK
jgi:hypothetical protein